MSKTRLEKCGQLGRRTKIAVASIAAVIGLAGPVASSVAADGKQPESITIGTILPLTGATAQNGENSLRGIRFAVEEINESGGIKSMGGAKLKLTVADATSNPAKAASAAINFLSKGDKPLAMVGAYASGLTETIARVTERARIPLLSTSFADTLTQQGYKFFFQLPAAASKMGTAQYRYAAAVAKANGRPLEKIAIVYANNAYGASQAESLKKQAEEGGAKVVLFEGYSPEITDANPIIAKVQASGADSVFSIAYVTDGVLLMRALKSSGSTMPMFGGTGGYVTPDFLKVLGSAANGVFSVTTSNPDDYGAIGEAYQKKYGEFMPQEAHDNAAAVYVIAQALEENPTTDPVKLAEAIHKGKFSRGAAGSMPGGVVEFDAAGVNTHAAPLMVQWQDGKLVGVWPENLVKGKPQWPGTGK
ncbi:ABC transporter substrate-binding protein OS=Castellaniella sp OX=1955812 GN=EPN31_01115 PE=3 SV=1 [Castellaniella denitrificans]|uniref:ABC transporter substrate-binding protein n=1 Tax=Castellaniella sp. TaxID=1955812 RepID=UPI002AFE5D11|nr:ABC transporter substrate-binding protein [Castellaniella sp.]